MRGTDYEHHNNAWSGNASLQLTHWGFVLSGQYIRAQRDLWGEKISWGEDINIIDLSYNMKGWQFSAGVIMPFGKYDRGIRLSANGTATSSTTESTCECLTSKSATTCNGDGRSAVPTNSSTLTPTSTHRKPADDDHHHRNTNAALGTKSVNKSIIEIYFEGKA